MINDMFSCMSVSSLGESWVQFGSNGFYRLLSTIGHFYKIKCILSLCSLKNVFCYSMWMLNSIHSIEDQRPDNTKCKELNKSNRNLLKCILPSQYYSFNFVPLWIRSLLMVNHEGLESVLRQFCLMSTNIVMPASTRDRSATEDKQTGPIQRIG